MIKLFFLWVLMITAVQKSFSQNNPDQIIGRWMSAENNLEVEIYKADGNYNAKVIWIDDSDDKTRPMNTRCDLRNPDETLRKRKIIGLVVMNGLTYNKENNSWEQGKIYDPHNGRDWNATACFTKNGLLKVRGYWGFQLLGKDLLFRKILTTNYLTITK
ncbi:MAG TPA: DUF2147 domain-containing protein [Hanamia sp.]|nr:DUF2147 domain-containing protein [Hanamia sp.]